MVDKKITIIGLGLIGGSLARALKERHGITDITVINRSTDAINNAIKDGTIARGFSELNEQVWDSDIIFICTPVKKAMDYLQALSGKVKSECIITDVGSTKHEIVEYVNKMENPPLFIGGHPMAGAEKTGYSASFEHLFENAFYVLTPARTADESSINLLTDLVKGIGAIPVLMDSIEHDRVTACISHVPHVIASALVNLVEQSDSPDAQMRLLAAGGFKDITRIASSSPEMWENIVTSNKKQIEGFLDTYVEIIQNFKSYIQNNDSKNIFEFFDSAKKYRDGFSNTKKGSIIPAYELIVDVLDKPGIIGEIATLLGHNMINIKNINVSNNREIEQGCLKITLSDANSLNSAYNVLESNGYKVYKF